MKKIINKLTYNEYIKHAVAIGIGATIWTSFKCIAYPQDPTELSSYWRIGYPVSIFFSGAMGVFFPDRPWQWGVHIIWVQFVIGLIANKGDLNLLPPGILFYMLLTAPCIMSGYMGAWISRVSRKRE